MTPMTHPPQHNSDALLDGPCPCTNDDNKNL